MRTVVSNGIEAHVEDLTLSNLSRQDTYVLLASIKTARICDSSESHNCCRGCYQGRNMLTFTQVVVGRFTLLFLFLFPPPKSMFGVQMHDAIH